MVLGGSNFNRIYNSSHHLPFEIGSIQKLPMKSCSLGRDHIGSSLSVIQKISSEANLDKQLHPDLLTSLKCLHRVMKDSHPGKLAGYIQRIEAEPFGVMCFTEEGVRLYHHLAKRQCIFFDATGTVVSLTKTDYEGRTVLYYSLVLQHPAAKQPPVAVAEYITSDHSALSILHFLEC